jgi:lipopolysaccharide transport system permease protein
MTMPVEATKYVFLGTGVVSAPYIEISVAIALTVLFSGLMIFQHVERTFIDTV